MKKIISPLIYGVFLYPVVAGIFLILDDIYGAIGIGFLFDMNGFFEALLLVLSLSTALFWLANVIMLKFEKQLKTKYLDHFRQSSLYYLALFFSLISISRFGYRGIGQAAIVLILINSVWAIIINLIFLLNRHKTNIS